MSSLPANSHSALNKKQLLDELISPTGRTTIHSEETDEYNISHDSHMRINHDAHYHTNEDDTLEVFLNDLDTLDAEFKGANSGNNNSNNNNSNNTNNNKKNSELDDKPQSHYHQYHHENGNGGPADSTTTTPPRSRDRPVSKKRVSVDDTAVSPSYSRSSGKKFTMSPILKGAAAAKRSKGLLNDSSDAIGKKNGDDNSSEASDNPVERPIEPVPNLGTNIEDLRAYVCCCCVPLEHVVFVFWRQKGVFFLKSQL